MTVRPGLATGPAGRVPVFQSPFTESNRRPSPYHGDALPTELKGRARRAVGDSTRRLVGPPAGARRPRRRSCPDEQPPVRGTRSGAAHAGAGEDPALQAVVGQ